MPWSKMKISAVTYCDMSAQAIPTEIRLHQRSRVLEVAFDDGARFSIPCELLRVWSPSAEVRGHGPGQEVLQIGKENVNIVAIEPIGNYAVKLVFDDGHSTGLYTWDLLYRLGARQDEYRELYLEKLRRADHERAGQES